MQRSELEIYKRAMDEVASVLITDGKGTITYVNDKYCKLTNYTCEELIGQDNRIFKSDYHSREFYENIYKELDKGNTVKTVFKNKTKDGSFRWLDTTILPLLDENNIPYQFFTILFDITDQVLKTELREEYMAELSHEIRTPLHGLLSVVDLLSGTELNQEQVDYLIHIKETSTQLGHLMNDLLVAIKIDSGKLQFEFRALDIHQLAKSLIETFSLRETTKNIHYNHLVDQSIQQTLLGDPTRLKQILFNLLDNALKFTEEGVIHLQAKTVEETSDNQTIEFQVIDTGISISNQRQKRIYEKLTVSDKTGIGLYGESGMSLRVVKNLIELQHGSFSFEIIEGTGSVFTFRIPYKKAAIDNESPDIVMTPSEQQTPTYNILIAEDDKINQMIYKKQMSRFNYTCKIANDGFETLELLQQESFDLLLLDMQMPGMNGDEVLQKIRHELAEPVNHIPVICISATVYPKVVNALMEAGADAFLTKPYKESELAEIITKTLSNVRPVNERSRTNLINLELLNQFANGDTEFIIEILEHFKSTTPDILESMLQNFKTNNAELCRQLHKYRSQVSLLGLAELTQLTLTLETALTETNSFEPYLVKFEKLLGQSQDVIVETEQLITKLKTGNRTL